jgi:hypothetical protein
MSWSNDKILSLQILVMSTMMGSVGFTGQLEDIAK